MTTQQQTHDIVIQIDGEVARLIEEINNKPASERQTEFLESFHTLLVDQLLGPFGLSRQIFQDRDGGPVTTLHNFEKGVTANDADAARHGEWINAKDSRIDRRDYDKALNAGSDMSTSNIDGYTKLELPEGPRIAARDHVISVSEIERAARSHLAQTREERVATATQEENLVLTSGRLNSSKSDADLIDWLHHPNDKDASKTNEEYYGVDREAAEGAYRKARKAVDGVQERDLLCKQAGEMLTEGGSAAAKLALRRMLGMLIHEVVTGVIADIRHLVRTGFESLEAVAALARERMRATWARIQKEWAEYLQEGVGAAISGFLASVLTFLINAVVTTVKNIVTMIREAVVSFVRAVRLIVSPPPGTTAGEVAFEVLKIVSAALATCLGIALEESIAKAMQTIPLLAPFASELAPVIAGVMTGALTLLTVLAFDKMREWLSFQNKELADVHRGQAVTLLRIKRTVFTLNDAHLQLAAVGYKMGAQFDRTRIVVNDARDGARGALSDYRSAVEGLNEVLKGLK